MPAQQKAEVPRNRRVPLWVLVIVPCLAVAFSNADVFLLGWFEGRSMPELAMGVGKSAPLSVVAGGMTLWVLLRLRREIDRRARTIVELDLAVHREQLLRRELDHRVRNNLSALLALVDMYDAKAPQIGEVVRSFRSRILTLREAYNLIAEGRREGIELADLLRAVYAAVAGSDKESVVSFEGPSVLLTSREANAFAMVEQELLTNAAKHGALNPGVSDASILVRWSATNSEDRVCVVLSWTEQFQGKPASIEGASGGLGLTLIQNFAAIDLRGNVRFAKQTQGWHVELVANVKIPPRVELG